MKCELLIWAQYRINISIETVSYDDKLYFVGSNVNVDTMLSIRSINYARIHWLGIINQFHLNQVRFQSKIMSESIPI